MWFSRRVGCLGKPSNQQKYVIAYSHKSQMSDLHVKSDFVVVNVHQESSQVHRLWSRRSPLPQRQTPRKSQQTSSSMAAPFPYAHYACPCSTSNGPASSKRASQLEPQDEDTFNPHDPRAAYALYPLDNLLFCDECSQIRCQKCVNDEIITWFCPSCLFDVPSGQVEVRTTGVRETVTIARHALHRCM